MSKCLTFILILCFCDFQAQSYRYLSPLPVVDSAGFYRIPIDPEILGSLNANHSDIRLYGNSQEVPYYFEYQEESHTLQVFQVWEECHVKAYPHHTEVIISNPELKAISNFYLKVSNAEVNKKARILGSRYEGSEYIVKDWFSLNIKEKQGGVVHYRPIDFGPVDYPQIKLEISDSISNAIEILEIGSFTQAKSKNVYNALPPPEIQYVDDEIRPDWSTYKLIWDKNYPIHAFKLVVHSPRWYHREVEIFTKDYEELNRRQKRRVRRKKNRGDTVLNFKENRLGVFQVNSELQNQLFRSEIRSDTLYLRIRNNDNPPLIIDSLNFYMKPLSIIAWLESGNYEIRFGNPEAQIPKYDLKEFHDLVDEQLPILEPQRISDRFIGDSEVQDSVHKNLKFWLGLLVLGLILSVIIILLPMLRNLKSTA